MINLRIYNSYWYEKIQHIVEAAKTSKDYLQAINNLSVMEAYALWRNSLTYAVQKDFKDEFHEHYLMVYRWSVSEEGTEKTIKRQFPLQYFITILKNKIDMPKSMRWIMANLFQEFASFLQEIKSFKLMKLKFKKPTIKAKKQSNKYFKKKKN